MHVRLVVAVIFTAFLLSACLSSRLNPLDPKNPNASDRIDVSLHIDRTGEERPDSLDVFRLALSASADHRISLSIWAFDTTGDGRADIIDTLSAVSRTYAAPRGRTAEIAIGVVAVAEDGSRGSDSALLLPLWRVFGEETGLPTREITAVAVDSAGSPWVGSRSGGLALYDGSRWTLRRPPAVYAFGDVNELLVDVDNNKWIGTNVERVGGQEVGGGLWLLDADGDWLPYAEGLIAGARIRYIVGLEQDKRGDYWILTFDQGVYMMSGRDERPVRVELDSLVYGTSVEPPQDALSVVIAHVAASPDGSVWFGSKNDGVFRYDGKDGWRNYVARAGLDTASLELPPHRFLCDLPVNQISALAGAPDGSVWMATPGAVVHHDPRTDRWDVWREGEAFFQLRDKVRTIEVSSATVWVGMLSGLVRIESDGSWSKFTKDNSALPDNMVQDIAVDSRGSVWLATGQGVVRYHRYGTSAVGAGDR